ncbi:MAG TPA: sigma-70 family RNA polymerase sigma factor [Gaiellaceae bacterium]|nr:sigma-70 family RNA polymerase sigma factor [Gaiellaceae bacterium]
MRKRTLIAELEALYRARYRQFVRVATAIAGEERAHDVVQEAFARAIRSSRSYRGEGTVEAWLWQVLINAARTERSARADTSSLDDDELPVIGNGQPTDDLDIRSWVVSLPERQKLAVFLRYYADLDYRTLASVLGVEVGTVSATLSAAHTSLRRSLKEVSRD